MIKDFLKKENIIEILVLLFVSIFICMPLFSNKIDIFYDDGIQHVARIIGTDASIKEGQTEIISNLCNEFGYSWNLFYSPITAFGPLIFKMIGFSYINSIKLFMLLVIFLSGISMYFFTKEITKSKKIALLAGVIYIFAPYRFTDMYVRNALAELTSFIFIPMIFQGLYGILKQKKNREILFIIGTSLLLLTHTIITMYLGIICFIYLLTQIRKLKIKSIRLKLIYSIVLILIITIFFWLPLLQVKNSAQYEVFKPGRMERQDVLIAFKLDIKDLIITTKKGGMIYEIGLISILALLFTPLVIKKLNVKHKHTDYYKFYKFSLITTFVLLFLTLKIFPFEKMPSILKMIQFTFRLLEFTSFFIAFIVAVNLSKILNEFKSFKYKEIFIIIFLFMISYLFYMPFLHYREDIDVERLIEGVRVTENTGRVHAGCASFEYLPSKAFENRKYIETRNNEVIVIKGNVMVENFNKDKSKLSFDLKELPRQIINDEENIENEGNTTYDISNNEEDIELELPYIYYPGYKVVAEKNGLKKTLKTYETDNGFVGIIIPANENNLKISAKYTGTNIMKVSKVISVIGISAFIINTININYRRKNDFE